LARKSAQGEQAMNIPPIPPESKFFKEIDGKIYFLYFNGYGRTLELIDVLLHTAEAAYWRFIIASVAAEEWLTAQKELEAKLKMEAWEKGSDPYRQLKLQIQACADARFLWREWGRL
jgi:hypothetical protein